MRSPAQILVGRILLSADAGYNLEVIGSPEDVRRWAVRWRAVDARMRQEPPHEPDVAVALGLDLIDHVSSVCGRPIPETEVRRREVEQARACWLRLLRRWPAR
jgi:hypothetical protein